MATREEDTLVIRVPGTTLIFRDIVCLVIMTIAVISLQAGGGFYGATVGFIIFMGLVMGLLGFAGRFTTTFSARGIACRSLRTNWDYSWEEIASWGRDIAPNGNEDIYFVVKDSGKRHYIQAVQDNMLESVRAYFRRQSGDPQIHTDGMEN